jgi:tetratricopeptide (TPR) repeat protein
VNILATVLSPVVIILAVFTNSRVEALTFRETRVTCPIDGKQFTAKVVQSLSMTGRRLDMKPLGGLAAPWPLPICPENGFVIFKETFSNDELEKLKSIVLAEKYRSLRRENTDYFLVAYMMERMGETGVRLGWVYLQASWEAEESQPALIERYRSLAVKFYDEYLGQEKKPSDQWLQALVITSDLERMLGRFDAARARLDAAELDQVPSNSPYRAFIKQIHSHAEAKDAEPEKFVRSATVQVSDARKETGAPPNKPDGSALSNATAATVLEDGPTRSYLEKYVSADWLALRRAYADSPELDPLGVKSLMERKAMNDAYSAGDFQKAVTTAKSLLDRNYVDIDANVTCDLAYQKLGKPELARAHRKIFLGLAQSIIGTNDGKSPEKAFEVITISEEHSVLEALRLKPVSQGLFKQSGHSYDVWSASDRNGEVQKIYFQVDSIMRAEAKLFQSPLQKPPTAPTATQQADPWTSVPIPTQIRQPKPVTNEQRKPITDDPRKLDLKKLNVCRGC